MTKDNLTETEKLKDRLAEQCGLDPEAIRTSRLAQYELLLSQGLGVRLSIGGSRLFRSKLSPRILGLFPGKEERKYHDQHIDLGEFFLAPKKVVRRIDNLAHQARNYLRARILTTIGFEFEPGWIWVPIQEEGKGVHAVKAKLEEYQAAYLDYVEKVAADIELHKLVTLATVEDAAPALYARLNGDVETDPDEFVAELRRFVQDNFPTADDVRAGAYFRIEYKAYPMPSQFATDQLRVAELSLERQQVEAAQELSDTIARAERQVVWTQVREKEMVMRDVAQKRQKMLLEAQRQALQAELKRKEEALDPMIAEIAGRIHTLVSEVAVGTTRAIQKKGKLPGPTARQVRSLVENLGPLLSLVGDVRLEKLAEKLDGLVKIGKGGLDASAISRTLGDLEEAATERVQALGPSIFEYLEV